MSPDRSHLHHRLVDMGFRQRHVVIAMYGITVIAAGLGMFMMLAHGAGAIGIFLCVLLLVVLVFHAAGAVRLRDMIANLRQKCEILRQMKRDIESFEKVEFYFQKAKSFDQWWAAVCEAAQRMDFAWISLKTRDKDGTERTEVWRLAESEPTDKSEVIIMNLPVRNNAIAGIMEFEIAILVNGSLESAGHRATLFSRLLDEHNAISIG